MKTIILKSGKRIKYREGFITPEGMEIIVPDNSLMPEEKREFKNKVSDIEEVGKIFYGETHTLIDTIL